MTQDKDRFVVADEAVHRVRMPDVIRQSLIDEINRQPIYQVPPMHQVQRPPSGVNNRLDFPHQVRNLPNGEVIGWTLGRYTYVAVKAQDQWYTTATEENTQVDQVLNDLELAEVLMRADRVALAYRWRELT